MRILHTADLHLDSPLRSQALKNPELGARLQGASRQVLAGIVDTAMAERVDALLIAGDLFDRAVVDVASRAALAAELGRLSRAGIPTVAIQGNHDALLDLDRFGPVADGVTVLDAARPSLRIGGATVHGLGFAGRHVAESLLPQYPPPEPGRINIGLMHTSLGGAPGHDPYAPCAEADLLAHGYAYWALGHIHARAEYRGERAVAVMAGIPQGRSIGETRGGSVTVAEIGDAGVSVRAVSVAVLRFATVAVDLEGADSQAAQIDAMATALAAAQSATPLAARLVLRGAGALAGDPAQARAFADEAARTLDGVYVEAVRFAARPDRAPPGILADLARMMAEDAASPGFRDEAAAVLEAWRRALPREIADTLAPEALDDLIAEGVETVVQRLAAERGAP